MPDRPINLPLRTPLNELLGTAASVRLLRVLASAGSSLSAVELARRAGIGRTNVYRPLEELERRGIVEFAGAGDKWQAQLRLSHPLALALRDLFLSEARRADDLIEALRELFRSLRLRPTGAWLERLPSEDPDDSVRLYVLSAPRNLPVILDSIVERLQEFERSFGVHLDLRGLARSELETRSAAEAEVMRDAVLLDGAPPLAFLSGSESRPGKVKPTRVESHAEHDERARRLGLAIATKLRQDPSLTSIALDHVKRRIKRASPGERRELVEWSRILTTMAPAQLRRFLVDKSERATRLRQSLPALSLLTPAERERVLASKTDQEVRAAVKRA